MIIKHHFISGHFKLSFPYFLIKKVVNLMIKCSICNKPIRPKDLHLAFKFTYGRLFKGEFIGHDFEYFHAGCLIDEKNNGKKAISEIITH